MVKFRREQDYALLFLSMMCLKALETTAIKKYIRCYGYLPISFYEKSTISLCLSCRSESIVGKCQRLGVKNSKGCYLIKNSKKYYILCLEIKAKIKNY